jgi:hypothetical protein
MEAKEFLLEEAEALGLVVGEEAGDLGPDRVRGVIVTDDGVEDLSGDGLEEHRMMVASIVSQSGSWGMARRSTVPAM